MEAIFDTAQNFNIIVITLAIVAVIALAKKVEKPILPAILIITNLLLLIYHCNILNTLPRALTQQISHLYSCLAMDFLWLLISFLGYLWIDDISAVKLHKKSYDDSLAWFWEKL